MSEPLEFFDCTMADLFATDLYRVEDLGCCSRLIFVSKRLVEGKACLEPALCLIVPNDRLPAIALLLNKPPLAIEHLATGDAVTLN